MKNRYVSQNQSRLDTLFKKTDSVTDLELKAHWTRYLCVLVSGFLETSIRHLYSDLAQRKASPQIANFVSKRLESSRNLNMEMIVSLANAFSVEWGKALEEACKDSIKLSIDSIYNNRNQIAHGVNIGMSYHDLLSWYDDVIKLIILVEQQCAV